MVVLGVAIAIPVLLASRGEQGGVTLPTITTTSEPAATSPTSEPDTTTTSPVPESPTTTTPAVDDASSFVLPEGTKLQREGENDPALVSQLQEALAEAGFDAGPADGTFGEQSGRRVPAGERPLRGREGWSRDRRGAEPGPRGRLTLSRSARS